MQNRNFQKNNPTPKTYIQYKKYNTKYNKPKKHINTFVSCKVCSLPFDTLTSSDKTQCNSCYNALFYYLYINMHLFVERDE